MLAGTDFFTVEVLTLRGLVTYYVLFFIHLESRKVEHRRDHCPPERAMDAANGSERDHVCAAVTKSSTGAAAICSRGGVKSSQW